MDKNKQLLARFSNIEKYNSQFSKCNVAIAYHGDNRNYSSISKEVFEDMIPSLYGIPIVGEWKTADEDFGTHGGKIEISDEGINYIDTTKPFGFIDSQAKVWWEDITEEDGTVNEYLMSECFLWTSRYPEAEKVLEGNSNQSMEIQVKSGEARDDGYFDITDAEFSALCILGSEVEPAFESAGFKQFNLDKEIFKTEFNLMVKELKQSAFEGGESVGEKFEEEVVETTEETFEETQTEEAEETTVDTSEEETVETKETDEEFNEEVTEVAEAEEIASEEVVETEVEEEFEAEEILSLEDYNQLLADYEILKAENEELKSFKADILSQQKSSEIEEVFAKYATLLDLADYEDLQEKAIDMDIESLEKELSFRLVQKKFDFSKIVKKDSTKITIKEDKDAKEPYGSASVYFNK